MRHSKHLPISPWNSILIKVTSVYFLYLYWALLRRYLNSTTLRHWDNYKDSKHMRKGLSFLLWIYLWTRHITCFLKTTNGKSDFTQTQTTQMNYVYPEIILINNAGQWKKHSTYIIYGRRLIRRIVIVTRENVIRAISLAVGFLPTPEFFHKLQKIKILW